MTNFTINTSHQLNTVSPILYGIFFEDINYAGDGGLYAELIANRSFEYYDRDNKTDKHKMCWETIGKCCFEIRNRFPLSTAHSFYAHLEGDSGTGLRNLGYCEEGLAVKEGQTFRFSCYARNPAPMKLTVRLCDRDGANYGEKTFSLVRVGHGWSKYKLTLTATGTCKHVYPEILLSTPGTLDLDLISLFPADTYLGRENGMRKDMAEMLAELSPKFMRFPGGCIVEGRSFENMYNWKETVGSLTKRRTNWNRWQMEEYQIHGRSSADYFQSYGLGYYEYFQFCEDIGAKPVPVMNVGMTCQWHESLLVDMEHLDRWIQDILDLIAFANGSADSGWGQIRAEMGHPEPFGLEYIGIGNEQWGESYFERYEAFQKVLSEKHPEIKLITCAGWTAEGDDFDYAYRWMEQNKEKAYAVDEHFYKSPEWFLENLHRYDNYDRSLPKVFAGEYAAHSHPDTPLRVCNWKMALCEAAFLTGVEKNADHVVMSCYAPLFGRTGHAQWQPDLIWFDNDSVYGTPSYYVQKLFSNHTGVSQVEICLEPMADSMQIRTQPAADFSTEPTQPAADFSSELAKLAGGSLHTSATLSEDGHTLYVKLVNLEDTSQEIRLTADKLFFSCTAYELSGELEDENSHEMPERVAPRTYTLTENVCQYKRDSDSSTSQDVILLSLPKYSVTVLELGI